MKITFCSLFSGSSGNAIYVGAGDTKKSWKLRCCKQACASAFRLFFCAFHARDCYAIGLLLGNARGGAPFFLREKRAGFALRRGRMKTTIIANRRGVHCTSAPRGR